MQSDRRFDIVDDEWLDTDEREPEADHGRPGRIWPDGSVLPYRDQRAGIGLSRWPLMACNQTRWHTDTSDIPVF